MNILYLYLNPIEDTYARILAGELPSNQLYGYVELKNLGFNVSSKDSCPKGVLHKLTNFLNKRFQLFLKDFKTLYNLKKYEVVVVKGPFSTQTLIACLIFNIKIVYLDPILRIPHSHLRKLIYKTNLKYADGTVVFSSAQYDLIKQVFNINESRLKLIPFCLDAEFFKPVKTSSHSSKPYILSVGMDLGRDYSTLIDSVTRLNIDLKIVTLPHLLKDLSIDAPNIEVLSKIPYKQLFELYAGASFVVIPLKKWATQYSSGTTNLLEAKLLGKAVISTFSKPLEEYLEHDNGVFYVEAEDTDSLSQAISKFLQNPDLCSSMEEKGVSSVRNKFNTTVFASKFSAYLEEIVDRKKISDS